MVVGATRVTAEPHADGCAQAHFAKAELGVTIPAWLRGAPSAARSSGAVTLRVAAPMSFQRDSCERLALTASTAAMTFSSSATQRSALCAVSPSCSAIAKTSVR